MLLNFRYFIFIIIVTFSCKHNDTPDPQNSSLNCQVVEYQENSDNYNYAFIYAYNEKSILKEIKIIPSSRDISIEHNNDGQIKSIDWFSNSIPEFFYDSQGRLKKVVSAIRSRDSCFFFEYDSKGHLSQSTWFPAGYYNLQAMYNPNFEAFVSAAISKLDTITDYSERENFIRAMEYTICDKYLVDEKNLTVTEIRNMSSGLPNRKFGDRIEEVLTKTIYDGKNSPYNSADWRSLNLYLRQRSLNDDRFPELGNALEKTSKFLGFSGDNFKRSYVYNNNGYPISGTYVNKSSNLNLTWKYNCK